MHTIASARAWAVDEFRRAGVEPSALAADLLVAFVVGRDRIYVLAHGEEELPEGSWRRFRSLVRRHAKGEPLQYITGEREFYGLDFRVTPAVLIPRPETEILVEAALEVVHNNFSSDLKLVDVGTGSGCIAVSIMQGIPSASGWATDISVNALKIAQWNARRHRVAERILFVQTNVLDCFSRDSFFNLILSNPPYVALEEYDTLASCVRDYEPRDALLGGRDGLSFYRRLFPEARMRLHFGGFLILEVGAGQSDGVQRLLEGEGFVIEGIQEDLQGIPRCLIARKTGRSSNG